MSEPVITSATAVFEIGNHYLNFAMGVCEQDSVNILHYLSESICGCSDNQIVDARQLAEQIRKIQETVEERYHIKLNQAYYAAPLLIGSSEKFADKRKSMVEEMKRIGLATSINMAPSVGGMQAVERLLPVSSKGKGNTLFLDLSYSTMGVVIVKNGQCAQQTVIDNSILRTMVDLLTSQGASAQEARTILRKAGSAITPTDDLRFKVGTGSMRKSELSQRIQAELGLMLSPLREKLKRFLEIGMPVYISGEGASLTGMREFLSDFFGTEVLEADWGSVLAAGEYVETTQRPRNSLLLCAMLQNQPWIYPSAEEEKKKHKKEKSPARLLRRITNLPNKLFGDENEGKTYDDIDNSNGRETDNQ